MKSSTVTYSLSSTLRNPRPSCWMKTVDDSVGLKITIGF